MRLLALFVVAILAGMLAGSCWGDELLGNRENCAKLGTLLVQSGDMRDAGMTFDDVQSRVKELIEESRKDPHGFVNTEREAKFVIDGVRQVWSRKDEPAYVIAHEVFNACVAYRGVKNVKATI